MSETTQRNEAGRLACSPLTGNLYLVMKSEELEDGKMVAKQKRILERQDIGDFIPVEAAHGAARRARDERVKA